MVGLDFWYGASTKDIIMVFSIFGVCILIAVIAHFVQKKRAKNKY